jgi:hypothetical protein
MTLTASLRDRLAAAEKRRRAWHQDAELLAACPKISCIAKVTTFASVGLFRLGKLIAGESIDVPIDAVDTLVRNGLIEPPDPAAVTALRVSNT